VVIMSLAITSFLTAVAVFAAWRTSDLPPLFGGMAAVFLVFAIAVVVARLRAGNG
jgi:hypothetical protein